MSMGTTAGYQRHPSTNTAHFFAAESKVSACKRETRTNDGDMIPSTDFMVCARCQKTEVRQEHEEWMRRNATA